PGAGRHCRAGCRPGRPGERGRGRHYVRDRSLALPLAAQLVADVHQDAAEHVLAAAVAAIAPVAVVLGVLDQRDVAGGPHQLVQVVVLRELGQDRLAHDRVLDRLPVAPKFDLTVTTQAGGFTGSFRSADLLLARRAGVLLGLEEVFAGRPRLAVQLDGVAGEV